MNMMEIERALRTLRLSGIRATLDTRIMQAQANQQPFIETFATFGLLEPDTDSIDDLYWEAMAGVNMGHWRYTRLTLQFELGRADRNFPSVQYFSAFGREPLYRHRAVLLMVGAAF